MNVLKNAATVLVMWLAVSACGLPLGGGAPMVLGARGPIKVALVDVFSGTSGFANLGPYLKNSLQLEIDDLNSRGGLLGSQLQLVTADDQYDMTRTQEVVKQLLSDHSVKLLVGPSFAGLYLAAKSAIDQAKVANCVTSMAADDVMRFAPFTFRAQEPDSARIVAILGYIRKSTPMKKVGLITEDDAVGHGYDSQLSEQSSRAGLQYIGASFIPGTASADHKVQVQQMLQRGAEAVVLSNNQATAAKTLQAIKLLNAGAKVHPFGFSGLSSYSWAQQQGDAVNGLAFASTVLAYLSDLPDARWPQAYRAFARDALTRYGTASNGVEMQAIPAGADCILQWARAVQAARTFDEPDVAKAWEALDIPASDSLLGVREHFSPTDHDAVPPDGLNIYQWARTGERWWLRQLTANT